MTIIVIFSLVSLHLGIQSGPCEEQLVRLDEQCNEKTYKVRQSSVFTITEKAPTRAFSWLKVPISAFTFKTLC